MSFRADQLLLEKLRLLPPQRRAEVEDFVDFLRTREESARDEASRRLGEAFEKGDALNLPPLTSDEVQVETEAARTDPRARGADRP